MGGTPLVIVMGAPTPGGRARTHVSTISEGVLGFDLPHDGCQHTLLKPGENFPGGIETRDHLEGDGRFVLAMHGDRHTHPRRHRLRHRDAEGLGAVQPVRFPRLARLKRGRHDASTGQVAAVNPLKALGEDGADIEKPRTVGGPVANAPRPGISTGQDHPGARRDRHSAARRQISAGCRGLEVNG